MKHRTKSRLVFWFAFLIAFTLGTLFMGFCESQRAAAQNTRSKCTNAAAINRSLNGLADKAINSGMTKTYKILLTATIEVAKAAETPNCK